MQDDKTTWRPIEPLPRLNGEISSILAGVDALRVAWEDVQAQSSPAEIEAALKRRLRRHAVETGIIERLYDVSWGVTEALVAEGLTSEVAASHDGISEPVLTIIQDQFEGLAELAAWAGGNQPLSLYFIRSLHGTIVRHQSHHEATTQFGEKIQVPLRPGAWKENENRLVRPDGSILECTPPLHVESEMQRLIELYEQTSTEHPIVRAAWLHHRFILIHPFADGNGRVARALTLLALLRGRLAPIVVDRIQRSSYLDALDQANSGDLRPLVRLVAKLEERALRAELTTPLEHAPTTGGAVAVARAYAVRLKALETRDRENKARRTADLAAALHDQVARFLTDLSGQFQEAFQQLDPQARSTVRQATPPEPEARYWHAQLINAAHLADFYTNLADGSWWVRLHLRLRGSLLRFIAAVQKVGQGETGVLALTVHAEVLNAGGDTDRPELLFRIFERPHVPDSVTLVYTDDVHHRWPEAEQLLDDTLSAAISRFSEHLA